MMHVPSLEPAAAVGSAALGYAEAGWFVLPVRLPTKHAGSVLGVGWPDKTSCDPDQLHRWFDRQAFGIALHVGRSGAIAFDVDDPEEMPAALAAAVAALEPPFQSTRRDVPGRGHYVFAQPPGLGLGNGKGKLRGNWGEVRGRNGIVVVQPTVHEKAALGGRYEWMRSGPLPPLPHDLLAALPTTPTQNRDRPRALRGASGRVHRSYDLPSLVQAVLESEQRNNAVFWASCRLGELVRIGRVPLEAGVEALLQAGLAVGLPRAELVGYDGTSGTIHSGICTGLRRST